MALAYAVILVDSRLYDQNKRDAVAMAQQSADEKFEMIAQEARKALVTRNPEPRVMTHPEMRQNFPHANLDQIVGLYFTADIS